MIGSSFRIPASDGTTVLANTSLHLATIVTARLTTAGTYTVLIDPFDIDAGTGTGKIAKTATA